MQDLNKLFKEVSSKKDIFETVERAVKANINKICKTKGIAFTPDVYEERVLDATCLIVDRIARGKKITNLINYSYTACLSVLFGEKQKQADREFAFDFTEKEIGSDYDSFDMPDDGNVEW